MQNVPCPITIVQSENGMPENWMNEFRAIPVTTPGSAIGRTSSSETDSRPKKRKRATAKAAALPSSMAISEETNAALIDSQKAERISSSCSTGPNQRVESPVIGHDCSTDGLKA